MYKSLAGISGVLIAFVIFFNGILAGTAGTYVSNLLYHFIGMLVILVISIIKKNKWHEIKKIPILFILPGLLNVLTVVLNNVCMNELGITITIGVSMLGQLILSNIIDHFGLLKMPVIPFKKEKLIGFSILSIGLIAMIWL
jgi:bacterial/archaeal transporter family-2 protein